MRVAVRGPTLGQDDGPRLAPAGLQQQSMMGGPPIFYLWRAICGVHGMAGAVGLPARALLVVMWLVFGVITHF